MSTTHSDDELVVTLRCAAQDLLDRRSIRYLERTLSEVVAAAVEMVPAATGGGISRTEAGTVRSSHATDDTIHKLDERQSELNEGPCITAADDPPRHGIVVADDLDGADRERWPHFASFAVDLGFRSVLSTHLASRPGGPRSALNLYAAEPHAFDHHARGIAGIFAVQAATLLYGAEEAQLLGRAVDSRDDIGQAKGILMERFAIDDAEAFQMLVTSSQNTNMKLVDVVGWLLGEARQRRLAQRTPSGTVPDLDL